MIFIIRYRNTKTSVESNACFFFNKSIFIIADEKQSSSLLPYCEKFIELNDYESLSV